jgi:hypothetical protein
MTRTFSKENNKWKYATRNPNRLFSATNGTGFFTHNSNNS